MSARFYVPLAQSEAAPLRQRIRDFGFSTDPDTPLDIVEVANVVCDCRIELLDELSESVALKHLREAYQVDTSDVQNPSNKPLAGALCVAVEGALRWILVRAGDPFVRQRFTVAHELGHLILEVEPSVKAGAGDQQSLLAQAVKPLGVFKRCDSTEPSEYASKSPTAGLSAEDLREIKAHHFAAELLMPYEGVSRLLSSTYGAAGIRTRRDREDLINLVAAQFQVSKHAARLRIEKDLQIVPLSEHPNTDLFG